MSDFDAQDVLRKVDEGLTPTSWAIMRARKSYFDEHGFAHTLIALACALGFALTCFITIYSIAQDRAVINDLNFWGLIACLLLVSLGFTIALTGATVSYFTQLRTVGTQGFVLTPEGCVARTGPKPYQNFGVAYAQVASIAMSVQNSRFEPDIALILRYTAGSDGRQRREQWRINPQFKANDAIAQAIIEAHTCYTVTHAPATAR